uniref:Uncharacterized protein n=1 Tax=Bactrocera latifrons TaxID=174628 RepID=A0A0K8WLM8_BACLA
MPQLHSEELRACVPAVTTTPTTTSASDSSVVANTKTLLLLLLTLGCLLSAVTCVPAPATALAAEPAPALHSSPPTPSLNVVVDADTFLTSKRHLKRSLSVTSQEIADKNNAATANSDMDDDYYDEEEPDAGNGSENVSGRQRRHHELSPTARFGYDGNKIKPQQFYTQQMVANALEGNTKAGTQLARPNKEPPPMAAQVNNDLSILSLMDNARRMDICDVCSCVRDIYVHVTCDYNNRKSRTPLNEIFGPIYRIPNTTRSIEIKLAANTHFRLERDLFDHNIVLNSFTIVGTHSSGEQVEITTGAFPGNASIMGPYPDIVMQNVFSVVVREGAFSGSKKFTVRNSNDLILYSNAFKKAEINGKFFGIADLRIEEKAFNSADAKLYIENSHIDNIYRFEASMREIKFNNCTINTINSGSFDVNSIFNIIFENSAIGVIKSRSITEKVSKLNLHYYTAGNFLHLQLEPL